MSPSTIRFTLLLSSAMVLAFGPCGSARGQQEQAVLSGIQYLRGRVASQQVGETAMIALALIKADTPKTDPVLASCVAKILEAIHQQRIRPRAEGRARRLRGRRRGDGAGEPGERGQPRRDEPGGQLSDRPAEPERLVGLHRAGPHGDTSISQYAILGLWECENAGFDVPPSVWDKAAGWYHVGAASRAGAGITTAMSRSIGDNMSMTAAGVGSLLICRRQLERFDRASRASRRS